MTIKAEILVPAADAVNVHLNTEIVFNLFDDGDQPIEVATIIVTVDSGDGPVTVLSGGTFLEGWTGEFIDNSINNSDFTIILIRPISDPNFQSGVKVTVDIDASLE